MGSVYRGNRLMPHSVSKPARMPRCLVMGILALSAVNTGCGGPSFNGTVYNCDAYSFRVPEPPAAWQRMEVSHAALSFRDEENQATIAVNGRCGQDAQDVPLPSLVQHLFLQFTERSIEHEEIVPFDGREAMHATLSAKLDGVPKKFDVWVLKKDGCVFDLIYLAEPGAFDRGVKEFHTFARGFSTIRTGGPDGS